MAERHLGGVLTLKRVTEPKRGEEGEESAREKGIICLFNFNPNLYPTMTEYGLTAFITSLQFPKIKKDKQST